MKRVRILTLLMVIAVMGSACVEEIGSMLVIHNEKLVGACELQPSIEGDFLPRGTLDISLTNRYQMFPTLRNELQSSKDVKIEAQAGAGAGDFRDVLNEGNAVTLEGATVSFVTPANVTFQLPQGLFIPVSGTIFPQGLTTTNLEVLSVDIGNVIARSPEFFDANNNQFRKGAVVTVLVNIKFSGVTTSGSDVESNEFTFPLDICAGCLLVTAPGTLFPDDDNTLTCDPSKVPLDNPNIDVDTSFETPCIIGQDDAVDCRLCRTLAGSDQEADALCDP